jgi:prepilin-type N-terminal cleavage/methylation domain-containing protein
MSAIGNRSANEAGQTLLEMLVALAIMTMVVGIAAPVIGRLLARRAMVEAQGTLAIEVAEAHADAVAHAAAVRLALAPGGSRLVASSGRPDRTLPAGAVLDWPRDGVVFYGDGSASAWDGAIHVDAATRRFHLDATRGRLDFGA